MSTSGPIARVRSPRVAGLLTEAGLPSCPFQSAELTPETPFRIVGRQGTTLYIRLLGGKHARRLAALSGPDLEVVPDRPAGQLVA